MFEACLNYLYDQKEQYENVVKIAFRHGEELSEISGDDMLKCHPVLDGTLYIHTNNCVCSVSCRFLKSLEIKRT